MVIGIVLVMFIIFGFIYKTDHIYCKTSSSYCGNLDNLVHDRDLLVRTLFNYYLDMQTVDDSYKSGLTDNKHNIEFFKPTLFGNRMIGYVGKDKVMFMDKNYIKVMRRMLCEYHTSYVY